MRCCDVDIALPEDLVHSEASIGTVRPGKCRIGPGAPSWPPQWPPAVISFGPLLLLYGGTSEVSMGVRDSRDQKGMFVALQESQALTELCENGESQRSLCAVCMQKLHQSSHAKRLFDFRDTSYTRSNRPLQ